jgi:hypothetical protein
MPASHFDVNSMTGRPKFIVRHSTIAIKKFWTDLPRKYSKSCKNQTTNEVLINKKYKTNTQMYSHIKKIIF